MTLEFEAKIKQLNQSLKEAAKDKDHCFNQAKRDQLMLVTENEEIAAKKEAEYQADVEKL